MNAATKRRSDGATKGNAARARFRKPAAVLLEVLIALAILILGMAAVGMQVNVGLKVATDTQVATNAVRLAESKWSEMDAGVLDWNPNEQMEGDFGIQYPGWAWRMYVDPTDTPDLNMVTLEILYKPGVQFREELASYEDMIVVHTSYSLRATPAKVNLTDFGVDLSALDGAGASGTTAPPAVEASGVGGGGGGGGPASAADLLNQLMELMPAGFDPMNIPPDFMKYLPPDKIPEIMAIVQQLLGSGGALLKGTQGGLSDLIQQMDKSGGGRGAGGGQGGTDGGGAYGPPGTSGPPDGGVLPGGSGGGRRPGRGTDRFGGGNRDAGSGDTSGPRPRRGSGRLSDDTAGNAGDVTPPSRSGGRGPSRSNSGSTGFGRSGSADSGSSGFGGPGPSYGRSSGGSGSGFRGSRFGSRSSGSSGGVSGGSRNGSGARPGSGRAGLSDPYRVPTEEDLLGGRSGGRSR